MGQKVRAIARGKVPMEMKDLTERLAAEIAANGGAGNLAGFQFGSAWNAGELFPRAAVARILDECGFPGAAGVCLDVTPEGAAVEAVRARSSPACTRASRRVTRATGEPVAFAVRPLVAHEVDGHVRAWGVYRERRRADERSSEWGDLGARIYVSTSGIHAASPRDSAEDEDCRGIADDIVAHAHILLDKLDGTLSSRALSRAGDEARTFTHLCAGLRLGMPEPKVHDLVTAYLRLRAEVRMPVNVEPRFRGGLSEAHVSESLIRSLQAELDELAESMRADMGRDKFQGRMLDRRRAAIRDAKDRVRRYESLLSGWSATLSGRLDSALRAYDSVVSGTDLVLPEWADEEARNSADQPTSRPDDSLPEPAPDAPPETAPAPTPDALPEPAPDPELALFEY